jgi:hypothetical protein
MQQLQLFTALKYHANVEDDRDEAIELIHALRDRHDVTAAVLRDIESFLASAAARFASARSDAGEAQAAAQQLSPPSSQPAENAQPEPEAKSRPEHQDAEPLKLPVAHLIELLTPFVAPDLLVSPEIPENWIKNARSAMEVPKNEPVIAVLNLAWFSSGSNALVVTDRAVHHRKLGVVAHIPFVELAGAEITVDGNYVSIGSDHHLSIGGTAAGMPKIESMLKALATECARRARDSAG